MIDRYLSGITFDPKIIEQRMRKRLYTTEIIALLLNFAWVIAISLSVSKRLTFDIEVYIKAGQGFSPDYYYTFWIIPFFTLLSKLPNTQIFLIWGIINIVSIFLAIRILGGNVPMAMLSYQMFYLLAFGQITGLMVFGLALLWLGIAQKRWHLAGLGFLIASTKIQSGLFPALVILFLAENPWKDRFKILAVPAIAHLASLIIYPMWPLKIWMLLQTNPPNNLGSLSPWRWIGPAALIFWLPALLLPMEKNRRIILLLTTITIGVPYYQQADLMVLFSYPLGWMPLFGNFGHLRALFGFEALQALSFVPTLIYLLLIYPPAAIFITNHLRHRAVVSGDR